MNKTIAVVVCVALFCAASAGDVVPQSTFIFYETAKPIIAAYSDSLPEELKALVPLDAAKWNAWVKERDREIRQRLERGEEDTLTNLLRFGVTFTKEYRIEDEYLVRYGESSLVNGFAENRVNDLTRALAEPNPPPGLAEMSDFLVRKGFSFKTPQSRAKVKAFLLANLGRMRDEFLKYHAQKKDESRYQLFADRGISLDTNLWPDYQLDVSLLQLKAKGLVKPGSIRRIAIVGPGLDFVNKEAGVDYYPPQTTQPFAVLDSLFRLGLADPANFELYTLDISPSVLAHVRSAAMKAGAGTEYVVQLPWNTGRPMSDDYRKAFVAYWQHLGSSLGEPVAAIPVPDSVADTQSRAVKIRADVVRRIISVDMNAVYQVVSRPPEQRFDLVVGTNVFLYYGKFEQALARANLAAILKPGGLLLSNGKLPDTLPSGLEDVLETEVVSSQNPKVTDTTFCYRRE